VKNLNGISFAVANAAGFVVRACEGMERRSYENVCAALAANSREPFYKKKLGAQAVK
jgi:hypothetical protein